MENHQDITYYENDKIGKGLPYAIVPSEELLQTGHIYTPSLRDFHVIFWFKKGSGKYYIDFQEYEIKPNTVILLSKDQVNYFGELDLESCEIQSIVFTPEFIYKKDNDLRHLFHFTVASHIEGAQILHLQQEQIVALEIISENMSHVYTNWESPSRENAFYHWLSLFLIHCERLQTHEVDCKSAEIDETSKQILLFNQLLEENFRKEYKVDFYL